MKTLSKHSLNKLLFIGLTATLLTACGGSKYTKNYDATTGELIELGIDNPVCQEGLAIQEGKVTDYKSNKGIADVAVEISGCTVLTDENGYYKFTNIPSTKRVSVNFEKEGYTINSEIISINESTANYLEVSLNDNIWSWSFNSEKGTGGGNVEISPDTIYFNNDESNYTGTINATFIYKNTNKADGRDGFPGTYQGKDSNGYIVPFVSYNFFILELKDKDNNILNVSEPISMKLTSVQGTNDETIPVWYYNKDQGIWIEKGIAYRDDNGHYTFEISDSGTWSLSKPVEVEMGLYKGKIIDEDENPINNVRIEAIGKNWITKDLTTDENGEFEVYVVPNQKFRISAYNFIEKFGAEYEDSLDAIAPGNVVEE